MLIMMQAKHKMGNKEKNVSIYPTATPACANFKSVTVLQNS